MRAKEIWSAAAGAAPGADDEPQESPRFRTVFISDLHLGTAGCQVMPGERVVAQNAQVAALTA